MLQQFDGLCYKPSMGSFTRWILAHRKLVAGFWIVLTVAGMATAGAATKAMDQKFSVPGQEGWETNQAIARAYRGTGGDGAPLIPVVTLAKGAKVADPGVKGDLKTIEDKLAKALPGSRIAGYASTGDKAFVSPDGRTTFALAYPPPDPNSQFGENLQAEKRARAALAGATVGDAPVRLTRFDALSNQSGGNQGGPGVLIEALIGGTGALLVLGFVFGSLLAFVPLMMALPAIMTSFLTVYAITTVTEISPIVQFLIALIGLGVAIDYSLLVVVRWREELAHGHRGDEAIVRAMQTAGRSVVFSGTTVAVGLLALLVLPVPFLRSVGIGGVVIPTLSVAVSLSLLPVVLHAWGAKLDWPHRRSDENASRAWTRWAETVVQWRWISALAALAVIGALVAARARQDRSAG